MAGSKYIRIAKKLQSACNKQFGVKLLIDQRQWYHKDKDTAITVYTLYQAVLNDTGKSSKLQLFQTYSQIQLVLYMRDMWYELNGWEVPTDNKVWEDIKQKYGENKEPSGESPTASGEAEYESGNAAERNRTAICDELYTGWKRNRSGSNDSKPSKTNG